MYRPDLRSPHQFRLLEAKTGFLPGSNGSARIRMTDGGECIVSVKSKVVQRAQESNLIEVDVDISGLRDDSNLVTNIKYNLTTLLLQSFPFKCLHLTSRYSYKLYIDCIVISHASYPVTLVSLTTYLALKTTRLPLLVSETNDQDIEELPTFSDDWDDSKLLAHMSDIQFRPPILITIGVVGSNILLDPSTEEEQVLDNAIIAGFADDAVTTPIINMNLAYNSNNTQFKGLDNKAITESIALCNKYCGALFKALDDLIDQDEDDIDGSIF
ncbi:uncharacterized protein KQ657_002588 [Scheffersomyces spartinae]|uniref:Ribosomal RNA-processing protein 42 n=1 Tax=Scheffersomyces spartinae TaxID=45513 RepID=A0A9P8AH02_9ASCO|nr:uncharacterized protein KQ657_002588 [Scheffersomyces spartinae]KAG7191981.1 hypothetical protein KQ657_002588 [Scheffersomyces spartinae]